MLATPMRCTISGASKPRCITRVTYPGPTPASSAIAPMLALRPEVNRPSQSCAGQQPDELGIRGSPGIAARTMHDQMDRHTAAL